MKMQTSVQLRSFGTWREKRLRLSRRYFCRELSKFQFLLFIGSFGAHYLDQVNFVVYLFSVKIYTNLGLGIRKRLSFGLLSLCYVVKSVNKSEIATQLNTNHCAASDAKPNSVKQFAETSTILSLITFPIPCVILYSCTLYLYRLVIRIFFCIKPGNFTTGSFKVIGAR